MKIVCISDTHSLHAGLQLPQGDILVHAGDFTSMGRPHEVEDFAKWLAVQPFEHKVVIAGNHDWMFELEPTEARALLRKHCPRVVYLQDSGAKILGFEFWGSPWQPEFCDWAFNLPRGYEIGRYWAKIPKNTDVLITHGPPLGILDRTDRGEDTGCEDLAKELRVRLNLKLHIFGHIHEGYGVLEREDITYVNASICTLDYKPTNEPVLIELKDKKS